MASWRPADASQKKIPDGVILKKESPAEIENEKRMIVMPSSLPADVSPEKKNAIPKQSEKKKPVFISLDGVEYF